MKKSPAILALSILVSTLGLAGGRAAGVPSIFNILPASGINGTVVTISGTNFDASNLPNFEAQVSTNLINWVTLSNALSLTNGALLLQDNTRTNRTASFYRIIEH